MANVRESIDLTEPNQPIDFALVDLVLSGEDGVEAVADIDRAMAASAMGLIKPWAS